MTFLIKFYLKYLSTFQGVLFSESILCPPHNVKFAEQSQIQSISLYCFENLKV